MEILFVLVPLSIFMAVCGLAAFLWAQAKGQFNDLKGPAEAILIDDCSPDS